MPQRILQRELVLLLLLIVIIVPLFIFTRSMAARNRAMDIAVASSWYRLAQDDLKNGNTAEAIVSFRKAATNDHDNPEYALALATALGDSGHTEEARQGLLRLRSSAPENGEINLSLARLAAKDGMNTEALRYYHNALYGAWPAGAISARRTAVRTELIKFLLEISETSRALSELLILESDISDNEQSHVDVGHLFAQARDFRHAFEQFTHALQFNDKNVEALEGAGKSAFELSDYVNASRLLHDAVVNGAKSGDASELSEVSKLVISRDPLLPRLLLSERVRRLTDDLHFAYEQVEACLAKYSSDQAAAAILEPLQLEATQNLESTSTPAELRSDAEGFKTGLNLIYRMESAATEVCNDQSSTQSRALLLIAKKEGVIEQ